MAQHDERPGLKRRFRCSQLTMDVLLINTCMLMLYRLPALLHAATPISPGCYCQCVQWAGSLGPHGERPTAIQSAYRSSLELYRHTIVGRTLETSSSGTQTPHTKCQFAAKLSALSCWFIEPGPLFTILSSSGGISIACAMGRHLFKSFRGFKKKGEKKDLSRFAKC